MKDWTGLKIKCPRKYCQKMIKKRNHKEKMFSKIKEDLKGKRYRKGFKNCLYNAKFYQHQRALTEKGFFLEQKCSQY